MWCSQIWCPESRSMTLGYLFILQAQKVSMIRTGPAQVMTKLAGPANFSQLACTIHCKESHWAQCFSGWAHIRIHVLETEISSSAKVLLEQFSHFYPGEKTDMSGSWQSALLQLQAGVATKLRSSMQMERHVYGSLEESRGRQPPKISH